MLFDFGCRRLWWHTSQTNLTTSEYPNSMFTRPPSFLIVTHGLPPQGHMNQTRDLRDHVISMSVVSYRCADHGHGDHGHIYPKRPSVHLGSRTSSTCLDRFSSSILSWSPFHGLPTRPVVSLFMVSETRVSLNKGIQNFAHKSRDETNFRFFA